MFPEDVETITMTKEDYDRNIEQLLVEKLELEHKYNLMKKNAYQLAMKIDKAIEYNKQIIEDVKEFYRPTKDIIYSGDTIIAHSKQNIEILKGEDK